MAGPKGRHPDRPGRQEMSAMRRPVMIGALATAVIALVASAAVAVGVIGPSSGPSNLRGGVGHSGFGFLSGSSRAAPRLPGTVVNVALTNMGGSMMAHHAATLRPH